MADDFKALLEEQKRTTRLLMSVEERAEEDARIEEASQKRSEAAKEGWEKRREKGEGKQSTYLKAVNDNLTKEISLDKTAGSEEKEEKNKEGAFRTKFGSWMKNTAGFLGGMASKIWMQRIACVKP